MKNTEINLKNKIKSHCIFQYFFGNYVSYSVEGSENIQHSKYGNTLWINIQFERCRKFFWKFSVILNSLC